MVLWGRKGVSGLVEKENGGGKEGEGRVVRVLMYEEGEGVV